MIRRVGPLPSSLSSSLLGVVVALAAAAACGPADGGSRPAPQVPAPTASAPTSDPNGPGPAATAAEPAGTASPPAPAGTTATSPPPFFGPMKPLAPTAMEAKLRDIGLDPAALPPLDKLDAKTLRDVMNTFTKALGVQCSHCHEKDFKAPTEKKKIATHMWNDFTRALAMEGGGAVYCDSCHGGRAQFLDRRDLGALGTWMQENYVDKMKRADGKEHICDTCHGDPFEGKILSKLWK